MFILDILFPIAVISVNAHALTHESPTSVGPVVTILLSIALSIGYYQAFMKRAILTFPAPEFRSTRHQKASAFPPPFPNGWFMVCRSEDVANGQVKEVVAFGRSYALYRTYPTPTDGQRRVTNEVNKHLGIVQMVEAYCPHLGANLGVAGEVSMSTNCLKCKFHGWEFDKDGKVVRVDGTDVVPNGNIKRVYHVCETNGIVHLWHDAEDGAPTWDLVHRDQINSGDYYLAAESIAYVNCHIQEIPENGADVAHLNVLHKDLVGGWTPNFLAFHGWTASWAVDQQLQHITNMTVYEIIRVWNSYTLHFATVKVDIHQIGPGLVTLDFHTPIGTLILHQCILPEKVTTQRVRHVMHASSTVPRPVAKLLLWAVHDQFNRDVPIWCTKRYEPKPVISKADGPLLAFRRWYQQFYSAGSVSFADALAQETMIDW